MMEAPLVMERPADKHLMALNIALDCCSRMQCVLQVCEEIGLKHATYLCVEIFPPAYIHSVSVRSYFAANFTLANYPLDK